MSDSLKYLVETQRELKAALTARPKLFDVLSGKWRRRLSDLVTSSEADLVQLQKDWSALTQQLASVRNHLETASKLAEQFRISRDDLLEKLDMVTQHRDEVAHQLSQVSSQREDLTRQLSQVSRQREDLTAAMTGISEQRDSLIKQISGLQAQIASIRSTGIGHEPDQGWLRKAYLDIMEKVLTGEVTSDPPINLFGNEKFDKEKRWRGLDWPQNAKSMIGAVRMHNFRHLVELAIINELPGDIVEAGVWRGGASIMAKAVIEAYGDKQRKIYLADSFEGLPPPDAEKYPHDAELHLEQYTDLSVSEEQVRTNFAEMGLLDSRVITVKGWFRDTMPAFPVETIAVLRLDGDMYESTIDPLTHLFDKVSPGGWVIIDDYDCFDACKAAVHDFLNARGLKPDINRIDGVGAFFRKD